MMKFTKHIIIFAVIVVLGIVIIGTNVFPLSAQPILTQSEARVGENIQVAAEPALKITPGLPLTLEIPSINLKTSIGQAGLTKSGKVEIPKVSDSTVWFNAGPMPGETGSAVISGHYGTWADGSPSVFDNLYKIKAGDEVYVQDKKGQVFTFIVTHVKIYDADAIVPEIFNKTDGVYLNLITCSGQWLARERTFNERLVVFTKAEHAENK